MYELDLLARALKDLRTVDNKLKLSADPKNAARAREHCQRAMNSIKRAMTILPAF